MAKRGAIEEAWVSVARRYEWHWYATLTFDPERFRVGEESCERAVRNWLKLTVDKLVMDRRITLGLSAAHPPVFALGAREWTDQASRHPHYHLLVGGVSGVYRRAAFWDWFRRCGSARILPFDVRLGGGSYLFKYVLAGAEVFLWNMQDPRGSVEGGLW